MLTLVESEDPAQHPDIYLVMTGLTVDPIFSRGLSGPQGG